MHSRILLATLMVVSVLVSGTHGVRLYPPSVQGTISSISVDGAGGGSQKAVRYLYGIVIDMGSKGSRVSVFQWPDDAKLPYTQVSFGGTKNSPWYYKIVPGVATLADPTTAGLYLKPLLDYAESKIPTASQPSTPIFIKGTDRLRQLNTTIANIMLDSISKYASSNYAFLLKPGFVGLLPGVMEGGLMWVSVNYLQGNFASGKLADTVGTLDMGSGSTQITFSPKKGTTIPTDYIFVFGYVDQTYTSYVHSFAGYGFAAALTYTSVAMMETRGSGGPKVIHNPCYLAGYSATSMVGQTQVEILGTGSWANCYNILHAYLNKTVPCGYSNCSFNGAFQPKLAGDFVAVSNYYDIVTFLRLPEESSGQDIARAGIQFCSLTWAQAQQQYPNEDLDDLSTFCYGANYLSMLILDGYGFGSQKIYFQKNEGGYPLTWALGEMIYELQQGW